jgi:hypothetical protein
MIRAQLLAYLKLWRSRTKTAIFVEINSIKAGFRTSIQPFYEVRVAKYSIRDLAAR